MLGAPRNGKESGPLGNRHPAPRLLRPCKNTMKTIKLNYSFVKFIVECCISKSESSSSLPATSLDFSLLLEF